MVKPDQDALRKHDYINLVFIGVILMLDWLYLYDATDFANFSSYSPPEDVDILKFSWVYRTFIVYLVFDTIYVFLIPSSTASDPDMILIHHIATLIYSLVPIYAPELSWHTAVLLTVELNTFALTARRNVAVGTMIYSLFNVLFYVTWVGIRLILFPIFIIIFCNEYKNRLVSAGYFNIGLLALVFQSLLTSLSFIWTWQLVVKLVKEKVKR